MKKIFSYFFLFFSLAAYAQENVFAYRNEYDDPLLNTQIITTGYSKMYYENGEVVFELLDGNQPFFNTEYAPVDEKKEFTVETEIKANFAKFKNGKIGVVWGYANSKNTNVLLLNESNQYQVYYIEKGNKHPVQAFNATGLTLAELNSKIAIRIQQLNGILHFFLNNKEIFSCPALKIYGHRVGYLVGTDARSSYMNLKQNRGPLLISAAAMKELVKKEACSGALENKFNEIKPLVSFDNKEIYFIGEERGGVTRTNEKGRQLYSATIKNEPVLLNKKMLGELLPGAKDIHLLKLTPDQGILFSANTTDNDSVTQIFYRTKWDGKSFSPVQKLFSVGNKNMVFGEGCFSNDERTFIFSARDVTVIPEQADLYLVKKINDSTWTEPLLLAAINSIGEEITPFLFYDDKTLYFSTDGRAGFGRMDVYVAKRLDDTWTNWSTPENLGSTVNGKAWDGYFYIPPTGDYGWMSSTVGFYNCLDLHRVKMNLKREWLLHGKVLNAKTEQVQTGARVRLIHSASKKLVDSVTVDKSGEFKFSKLKPGEYLLDAECGILHNSIVISVLENRNEHNYNVLLTPPTGGSSLVLKNISFEPNKFAILSASFSELDKLAKYLIENKDLRIEVHGHTSLNNEGEKFNIELSTNRAAAVKNYLISHGIKEERIDYKGYGFNEPIYKGNDPSLQSINRRVEIIFLK